MFKDTSLNIRVVARLVAFSRNAGSERLQPSPKRNSAMAAHCRIFSPGLGILS